MKPYYTVTRRDNVIEDGEIVDTDYTRVLKTADLNELICFVGNIEDGWRHIYLMDDYDSNPDRRDYWNCKRGDLSISAEEWYWDYDPRAKN